MSVAMMKVERSWWWKNKGVWVALEGPLVAILRRAAALFLDKTLEVADQGGQALSKSWEIFVQTLIDWRHQPNKIEEMVPGGRGGVCVWLNWQFLWVMRSTSQASIPIPFLFLVKSLSFSGFVIVQITQVDKWSITTQLAFYYHVNVGVYPKIQVATWFSQLCLGVVGRQPCRCRQRHNRHFYLLQIFYPALFYRWMHHGHGHWPAPSQAPGGVGPSLGPV